MTKHIIIIALFAWIPNIAFGQPGDSTIKIRKSNIRFGIGATHIRMIDEGYTDSRLLFRGTNIKFNLAYGRETEKRISNFSMAGSVGQIKSVSGDLPSKYYFAQASLEFLRKIKENRLFNRQNIFFLGAVVSSSNQGLENERVIDNISIYSLHGISAVFRVRHYVNKTNYFQASYSMPLLIYENRLLWNGGASEYTYYDIENIPRLLTDHGKFSYFNIFGNIQLGVDYVVQIGKATAFIMGYKFFAARSTIEAPLNFYSNELVLELKISL